MPATILTPAVEPRTAIGALCLVLLTACSVFPEAALPPHRDVDVWIEWDPALSASGEQDGWVAVPASSDTLTVYALELDPPAVAESFGQGQRRLQLPAGTAVRARCRLRDWGLPGAEGPQFRTLDELFPQATTVRQAP